MYQQFALTIAISVLLSAFSALSLSPALCRDAPQARPRPARGPLGAFFRGFNWVFDRATNGYVGVARLLVRRAVLTILIVGVVAVGAGLFGRALPAGFIPDEDQGLLGVNVQLPPGASLERTGAVLTQVEQIVGEDRGRRRLSRRSAASALVTNTYQPNFGTIFVRLKPWEERHGEALHVKGIMADLAAAVRGDPRGGHLPVQHPHDLGLRRLGRLQLPAPGPERHAERRGARGPDARLPDRGAPAARARQPLHLVRPELSPGEGGARPREGAHARRARQRRVPGACRPCWAAPT